MRIPAPFRFLHWQRRLPCQCCDHRSLGSGAMPVLDLGRGRPLGLGRCRLLGFGAMPAFWIRGDAGFLAWGIVDPLDRAMPAPGFGALPIPWFRAMPAPWFQGNAGPWIRAFILTASKSKINDETPLNSCSLRGRSSLFRDIAVLG